MPRYAVRVLTLAGEPFVQFNVLFNATARGLLETVGEICMDRDLDLDCVLFPANAT